MEKEFRKWVVTQIHSIQSKEKNDTQSRVNPNVTSAIRGRKKFARLAK
jgi:hypothetical protein